MEPGARAQGTQLPVCSWVTEAEQAEKKSEWSFKWSTQLCEMWDFIEKTENLTQTRSQAAPAATQVS